MCRLCKAIGQKPRDLWKNYGFCTMIIYQLKILAKNETVTMLQPPYSPDLAHANFFLFPKTENTNERRAFCYDWEGKRKIETEAVSDTKSPFQKSYEDWRECYWNNYQFELLSEFLPKVAEEIFSNRPFCWKYMSWGQIS